MIDRIARGCRNRLTSGDFQFIAATLAASSRSKNFLEQLFEDEASLISVLDHPKLLSAILSTENLLEISPELYFYVLARHALKITGIDDETLADYVGGTLAEYARTAPITPTPQKPFLSLSYHTDLLEAIEGADNYERFYLYAFSANQFLILTGIFSHFLENREQRRGAPGLDYYEAVASNAFRSAGNHPLANEFAIRETYLYLAEAFREIRIALNHLTDEFLIFEAA